MDGPADNSENKDERKKLHFYYLSIISVLGLLCIILTVLFFNQRTKIETIEKERIVYLEKSNTLQDDLADLKSDYENLQTSDKKIKAELDEKIKLIEELQLQAEKHKGDAYMIFKLEKEAETLRKIMKHFVQQIDSLGRLNKEIYAQKEKVETQLTSEKEKTTQLTKEKEDLQSTVNIGSILKASNIKVTGVRYKSGGKKEMETKSAKKVEKIKMTFTIGENKIAKKGDRTIFARIVTPDGKEMAKSLDESNTFKFGGNKGYFAAKTTVSYNNEEKNVTFYTSKTDVEFLPGKYLIEISTDEFVIGTTTLVLE